MDLYKVTTQIEDSRPYTFYTTNLRLAEQYKKEIWKTYFVDISITSVAVYDSEYELQELIKACRNEIEDITMSSFGDTDS